jgi:hypothetical protein
MVDPFVLIVNISFPKESPNNRLNVNSVVLSITIVLLKNKKIFTNFFPEIICGDPKIIKRLWRSSIPKSAATTTSNIMRVSQDALIYMPSNPIKIAK